MRISDDPLAYSYGSILGPIWPPVPQFFFCLILPEFCDFSGVLYLRYLIFLRMRFLQKFWVLATFLVFWWFSNSFGTLGPKMDKTYNLWVRSIWSKIQNFEGFSKHCALLEATSGQNPRDRRNPKKPKKRPSHGCWINTKNFEIFNFNPIAILTKFTTDYIS